MPLYFTPSIGPFRYVRRVDPRRRGTLFWVAVGWWWCPMVLMLSLGWALCRYAWIGSVMLARYCRAATAAPQRPTPRHRHRA